MSRAPEQIILDALAEEERRVLSDWRALLYLRRAAAHGDLDGQTTPDAAAVDSLVQQLVRRGDLRPVPDLPYLFEATYAQWAILPPPEYELLLEAHPYSALASISALVFHGVSYQFPRHIVAIFPEPRPADFLPLDTTAEDWLDDSQPPTRTPDAVGYARMDWREIPKRRFFGIVEDRSHGYPVRVTDLERTLLDALLDPQESFGLDDVLSAWGRAGEDINVETLVQYVERFGLPELRQQAGYVLEAMHFTHPRFDVWAAAARRAVPGRFGGLSFVDSYSERWNLLVSAPMGALYEYVA